MNWQIKSILFSILYLYINMNAQGNTDLSETLSSMSDFAEDICEVVVQKGSNETLEITANGQTKLKGIAKKIADIGIDGSAIYSRKEYEGVLQKDLATLIVNSNNCKLEVLKFLEIKFPELASYDAPEPTTKNKFGGWLANLNVSVSLSDKNGNLWDKQGLLDKKGAPDLGICITFSDENRYCDPLDGSLGNYGWGNIMKMKCKNSFSCTYESIRFPQKEYSIEIFDVDQNSAVTIAKGNCFLGKECDLGKARIGTKLVRQFHN